MIYGECRLLGDGGTRFLCGATFTDLLPRETAEGAIAVGTSGSVLVAVGLRTARTRSAACASTTTGRTGLRRHAIDIETDFQRMRSRQGRLVHPDSGIAPPLAPSGQRGALTALTPGSRMIFPKPRHAEQLPKDHAVPASNPASPTGHCWR